MTRVQVGPLRLAEPGLRESPDGLQQPPASAPGRSDSVRRGCGRRGVRADPPPSRRPEHRRRTRPRRGRSCPRTRTARAASTAPPRRARSKLQSMTASSDCVPGRNAPGTPQEAGPGHRSLRGARPDPAMGRRAAAISIANGIPSRCSQMSATTGRSSSRSGSPAGRDRGRGVRRRGRRGAGRDAPPARRAGRGVWRVVASTVRCGQWSSRAPTRAPTSSMRCSQLSRTSRNRPAPRVARDRVAQVLAGPLGHIEHGRHGIDDEAGPHRNEIHETRHQRETAARSRTPPSPPGGSCPSHPARPRSPSGESSREPRTAHPVCCRPTKVPRPGGKPDHEAPPPADGPDVWGPASGRQLSAGSLAPELAEAVGGHVSLDRSAPRCAEHQRSGRSTGRRPGGTAPRPPGP